MKVIGLAVALLLISVAAHAEEGASPPRSSAAFCGTSPGGPSAPAPHAAPTLLRIIPPRHATVLLDQGGSPIAQISAPATIAVPTGRAYTITAVRGAKVLWTAKVAAAGGDISIVWGRGAIPVIQQSFPTPSPVPVPSPGPSPLPHPLPPSPMASQSFKELLATLDAESFESGKMSVLKTVAVRNHFTVAQLGQIVDELVFDTNKVEAVALLKDRVVDPQNGFLIARHFTFQSSQEQAVAMFGQ